MGLHTANHKPRPSYHSLYKTDRWRQLRLRKLAKNPYCQCPHHIGKAVKADTVDHIKPHKGDTRLFWNETNLQSLARECHNKFKQSEEAGGRGFNQGSNADGSPLNLDSAWYS